MESTVTLTIISGILLLLLIVSGVRLRVKGEPYKMPVLTAHKVVTIAIPVLLIIIMVQHFKEVDMGITEWLLIVLSTLFFLIALATGGALTREKPSKEKLKKIHRLATLLAVVMIPLIWIIYH